MVRSRRALALSPLLAAVACSGPDATVLYQDVSARPTSLWVASASDLWIGTTVDVAHFDGTAWKHFTVPTNSAVTSMWGRSAREVYAVGNQNDGSFGGAVDVLRYDGASWSVLHHWDDNAAGGALLVGEALHGGNGLRATGDGGLVLAGSAFSGTINQRGWLAIFDGTQWVEPQPPTLSSPGPLAVVAAPSRSDVWILDRADLSLHRFDGSTWIAVGAPGTVDGASWVADDDYYAIDGQTRRANRVHPVGTSAPLGELSDGLDAIVARSPTEVWGFGASADTTLSPFHVSCSGLLSGCGIGGPSSSQRTVLFVARWDGSKWTRHSLGDESFVAGLFAPGDGALYFIAGATGALLRWPVGS